MEEVNITVIDILDYIDISSNMKQKEVLINTDPKKEIVIQVKEQQQIEITVN